MAQVGGPLSDERFAPPGTPADWWNRKRWVKSVVNLSAQASGVLFRGRCLLRGYSIAYIAGAVAAYFVLYDGLDTTGEVVAAGAGTQPFGATLGLGDGMPIERGLYLLVSTSSVYGGIFIAQPMAGDDPDLT